MTPETLRRRQKSNRLDTLRRDECREAVASSAVEVGDHIRAELADAVEHPLG
jgi:hypothetical protein